MELLKLSALDIPGLNCELSIRSGEKHFVTGMDDRKAGMFIGALFGFTFIGEDRVVLLGDDVSTLNPSRLRSLRRKIGLVSRSSGLISNLKVWENVYLPLQRTSSRSVDQHGVVARALAFAGYEGSPYALPGQLDSFDMKKVLLARAFAGNPELLVCDRLLEGHPHEEGMYLRRSVVDFLANHQACAALLLVHKKDAWTE